MLVTVTQVSYNRVFPFFPNVFLYIVIIHFIYIYMVITQHIVTIITLIVIFRSINKNKNILLYLYFFPDEPYIFFSKAITCPFYSFFFCSESVISTTVFQLTDAFLCILVFCLFLIVYFSFQVLYSSSLLGCSLYFLVLLKTSDLSICAFF